jgi:hypothetical protein
MQRVRGDHDGRDGTADPPHMPGGSGDGSGGTNVTTRVWSASELHFGEDVLGRPSFDICISRNSTNTTELIHSVLSGFVCTMQATC